MDIKEIRRDFPLFQNYPNVAYLDNAATTQRPERVLLAEKRFYEEANANPLRGLYELSQKATDIYEDAREVVRAFIGARSTEEIVFTRNSTESLNLLAYSYGSLLQEGDEIAISVLEHHSNLIPWQQLAKKKRLKLQWIEIDENGRITEDAFRRALSEKTKLVSMTLISNVLGTRNDVKKFARIAHEVGAVFVCDGAQGVPHVPVDVNDLGVDFLAFSGHKMLGPMGIGVLYGRKELLDRMPPFLYGGEMIEYVGKEEATWAELPHKFEAGTVNGAGAAGLAAAIQYYENIGFEKIVKREEELGELTFRTLSEIPHVTILGAKDAASHHGIFSFMVEGVHPHDIAEILSADDVCVRAGHHCAQVLMKELKVNSTARVSIAFYNTEEEIIRLGESIRSLRRRMGYAE
ncbi:MAG: cysteine desulfurase [Lachnospiraceae bacterium]|nr:cysteine desulfurase [Lachnospiraceae bacterium]MBR4605509.1 cysteine desulfurase [Lachnospiraceae bacterium]